MSYKLRFVKWDPRRSTRKVQMLEIFTHHEELTPGEYAAMVGWIPSRDAWTYLRRHWRNGYLRRKKNWSRRLVYRISPRGAAYLLWWKASFPNERVRL